MNSREVRERAEELQEAYYQQYGMTVCVEGESIYGPPMACPGVHEVGGYCEIHTALQQLYDENPSDLASDVASPRFAFGCLFNLIMIPAFIAGAAMMFIIVGTAIMSVVSEGILDVIDATPLSPGDDASEPAILLRSAILYLVVGAPFYLAAYRIWRSRRAREGSGRFPEMWGRTFLFTLSVYVAVAVAAFCHGIISTVAEPLAPGMEANEVTLQGWMFMVLGISLLITVTVNTIQLQRQPARP